MFEIIDDWKTILDVLIAAPIAWQSAEEIATALGRGIEETTDLLEHDGRGQLGLRLGRGTGSSHHTVASGGAPIEGRPGRGGRGNAALGAGK